MHPSRLRALTLAIDYQLRDGARKFKHERI
jgi:hypothetical protein